MRQNLLPTLAVIGILFIPACRKQVSAPSPVKPDPESRLSVPDAMRLWYGNFDAQSEASTTVVSPTNYHASNRSAGQQMIVRPAFHVDYDEGSTRKFAVLTYAVPTRSFDCHACAPTIGMAVFSITSQKWTIESSNSAATTSGGWGKPPSDIQLIQIGANRHAIQIRDADGGQGETTILLQLLTPWKDTVNLGLDRIIADDDSGACGVDGDGLPCYSNRRTMHFVRMPDAEYDNLELELTGTDLPASESAPVLIARKVSGLEVLRFEKGKYFQISRRGDITNEDRFVAAQPALK
jgi:hypothetical protein